ncbi:Zinc finger protein, partial [Aphis craccivora]
YCNVVLRAHHNDLVDHSKTAKHVSKKNSLNIKKQPTLNSFGISTKSNESKISDLKLAVHIAAHSSVRSIDHLGEILKSCGKGSTLENIKMHRTKCSQLILNAISPALSEQLVNDIGDHGYSLIVDESTDISVTKYMAFCVRYFSKSLQKITTQFLGLVNIERATAIALRDITLEFLKELKLVPENIIGLGVDGASNLCGKNHSLFTLLQEISPKLQLIKCGCHSLNICSSKASLMLPANVEFLLRESVNWFSHSALRQIEYSRLFNIINGEVVKQRKLIKISATRWLAFYNCIKVILEQWTEDDKYPSVLRSEDVKRVADALNNSLALLPIVALLKKFLHFNPTVVLSAVPPKFTDMPLELTKINTDMELLEMQWRKLGILKYSDICCSTVTISEKDSSEFWVDVYNIKDSGGKTAKECLKN